MTGLWLAVCIGVIGPFHVRTDGIDDAERDGLTPKTAFASVGYACDRVRDVREQDDSVEPAVIRLATGQFAVEAPILLPTQTELLGVGFHGKEFSRLVASSTWPLQESNHEADLLPETMLQIERGSRDVKLYGVQFESAPEHLIGGAIHVRDGDGIEIHTCRFRDFRWFGITALFSQNLNVHGCGFHHCSQQKKGHRLGQIYTSWIKDSRIGHCRLVPKPNGGGYGYKGGGHENVEIHDNLIEPCYFAIESPHESEYGLHIHHNELHGAISVPKGGPGADPQKRGQQWAVEIDYNVMTDSYAIEGPRNHLWVHHNHIHVNKPNGRIYAQFGGENPGPIRFDHNVIENVDRSLLWVRNGYAADITFEHNTVLAADAKDRTGDLFSVYDGKIIDGWKVRKNILIAAWNRPRRLFRTERGVPEKIECVDNWLVNIVDPPSDNHIGTYPSLIRGTSDKPFPFFAFDAESIPNLPPRFAEGRVGAIAIEATMEPVGIRRQ